MLLDSLTTQVAWLFLLAMPIACVSWTIAREEISREFREWCTRCRESATYLLVQKVFYVFTCEYCASHWVTLAFLLLTDYRLLLPDWRGFVIAWFSLVWVANMYMNFFGRMRVEIKNQRAESEVMEAVAEAKKSDSGGVP